MTSKINTVILIAMIVIVLQVFCSKDSLAGLVAYWDFEEGGGTTLNDISGNGHTGTIHGASWATGKYGTGLFFDGSNDYVSISDSSDLNPSTEITVEFWVNIPSDINHWGGIIEKGHNDGTSYHFNARLGPTVSIVTAWPHSGDYTNFIETEYNQWHHIAFTFNNGIGASYLDGNLVDEQSGKIMTTQPGSLLFGVNAGGGDEYGRFWLDEVRIYNHALTANEIRKDMMRDSSGYISFADFDRDGDVDAKDLAKFSSVFGTTLNKKRTRFSRLGVGTLSLSDISAITGNQMTQIQIEFAQCDALIIHQHMPAFLI